jgi:hypothetical protein
VTDKHQYDIFRSGIQQSSSAQPARATVFRDRTANALHEIELPSIDKLAGCLRATKGPSKDLLPWLKLAKFGREPSDKGCYRCDANAIALFGCEGDYDRGEMPIADAAARLQAAGLEAVLSETPTRGHWRAWLLASNAHTSTTEELRALRARWVARVNGLLGGVLAPESFVLSQAFYVGGILGQPEPQVLITRGIRIDLRDDLDAAALYPNGTALPIVRHQPAAPTEDLEESDDDPRLLKECRSRVAGFARRWGNGTTPTGERAHKLVQWLADIGTSDGLTPSAGMIRDVIRDDYPRTRRAVIEDMLERRRSPRGWDVIDAPAATIEEEDLSHV